MSKKLFVCICLFVVVVVKAFSQHKIDSLTSVISSRTGIERFDPLVDMVRLQGSLFDNQQALIYAREALQLAYQAGDTSKIVTSSGMIAELRNRLSMEGDAEVILLKNLPIAKRHGLADDYRLMLLNLCIVYTYQRDTMMRWL
jgi:hypothetical protein